MGEPKGAGSSKRTSEPFIVELSLPHTHTMILLHGLGSNGEKFGKELLETGICADGSKLTDLFPGTRFAFPTSKRRRSSAFRRSMLTQWFDIASLDDPSNKSHTQVRGLEESRGEIMDLLDREFAEGVPRQNIIIGGLSQGCAMALIVLLSLRFPVGGFVGMSGWMPFRRDIEDLASTDDDEIAFEDDVVFGSGDDDDSATAAPQKEDEQQQEMRDPVVKVLEYVTDMLSVEGGPAIYRRAGRKARLVG